MKDGAVNLTGKKGAPYKGGSRASYTPSYNADPYIGGKVGKVGALGNPAGVVVGGASEVAALPALPGGNFRVGEDKNVSTPVSG